LTLNCVKNVLFKQIGFMSDEQILVLIKNKNSLENGFSLLMSKYQDKLYQHIRRMVVNHEDTNDILQNTFIKVYRSIGKFEERSRLYTWIYRIATNEALTHLKKNKKYLNHHNMDTETFELENKLKSDESPDGNMVRNLLGKAIETLPEKQKSVFSLRYYEEMSYREISSVLETSEGALKASFHHAVKKIEQYFKTANIY